MAKPRAEIRFKDSSKLVTCSRLCGCSDEDCIIWEKGKSPKCSLDGRFIKLVPMIKSVDKLKPKSALCQECDGRIRRITLFNGSHADQCQKCGVVF